jgi:hypothetical protein
MLRVVVYNVMGRETVSVLCTAHGYDYPHCVWSKVRHVGPEDACSELYALEDALHAARRSWERGEWDFSDDCYPTPAQPWEDRPLA